MSNLDLVGFGYGWFLPVSIHLSHPLRQLSRRLRKLPPSRRVLLRGISLTIPTKKSPVT